MSDKCVPTKQVELLRLCRVDDLSLKELITCLQGVEESDAYIQIEDEEDYDGYMETSLVVYKDVKMSEQEIMDERTKEVSRLRQQVVYIEKQIEEILKEGQE
jgi:predicted DNA-binding protein YlxM (UPF0122 family)